MGVFGPGRMRAEARPSGARLATSGHGGRGDQRPAGERGRLGRAPGGVRQPRAGGGLLLPALQARARRGVQARSRGGAGGAAAGPGGVRAGRGRRAGWSRIAGASRSAGARSSRGPPIRGCSGSTACPGPGGARTRRTPGVWAVTCFFVRAGFRRQGVSAALARAAVDFARAGGARALEGYPMLTAPGQEVAWGEMSVGARSVFAAAGFREVSHPSARRVVMRIELQVAGDRAEDP